MKPQSITEPPITEYKTVLKIDLDILKKQNCYHQLVERLVFLSNIKLIDISDIVQILLYRKTTFSAKIFFRKRAKPETVIILQAILGDDYKRVGITYRDYLMGIKHYNRMFDMKVYPDNSIRWARVYDITELILFNVGLILTPTAQNKD